MNHTPSTVQGYNSQDSFCILLFCCSVSIQSFTHGLSILFQGYIPGDLYIAPNHPSHTILAYFSIKTCLNQHQVFNQPRFSRWNHHVLVVSTNHSEKSWSSSVGTVGMMNFPIWWESQKNPWFQSPISHQSVNNNPTLIIPLLPYYPLLTIKIL